MNNKIREEMNKIEIPKELSERSINGVYEAKKEMKKDKKKYNIKSFTIIAALFISFGTFSLFNNVFDSTDKTSVSNQIAMNENGGVEIPKLKLPEGNSTVVMDMIGLIVYNGNIYTQTNTEIDTNKAKDVLGEKIGTTKGTIDEWSEQEAYAEDLASTIGITNVYSVKGYDKDFRIMTYEEKNGEVYSQFYENLNGVTINSGKDLFDKLNMSGNVFAAQYRTYSDWDNSIENFKSVTDMEALNVFVEELNNTKPYPRGQVSEPINDYRNDEHFRELSINLNNGSTIKLTLFKEGYIYYGYTGAYFKMNEEVFSELWINIE